MLAHALTLAKERASKKVVDNRDDLS